MTIGAYFVILSLSFVKPEAGAVMTTGYSIQSAGGVPLQKPLEENSIRPASTVIQMTTFLVLKV